MDMPTGVLFAFVRMLPRLRAEDSMRSAEIVALGTGSMDKKDARSTSRRWAREADPDSVAAERPVDEEQRKMMIASVGIQIDE